MFRYKGSQVQPRCMVGCGSIEDKHGCLEQEIGHTIMSTFVLELSHRPPMSLVVSLTLHVTMYHGGAVGSQKKAVRPIISQLHAAEGSV